MRPVTLVALCLGLLFAIGCEETKRSVYRQPAPDGSSKIAESDAIIGDCVPACKLPKFCDTTTKPPKCVVRVDNHGSSPTGPQSLQINLIGNSGSANPGAAPGTTPSDGDDAPSAD